jgi:hypothetical protein
MRVTPRSSVCAGAVLALLYVSLEYLENLV